MSQETVLQEVHDALEKLSVAGRAVERARLEAAKNGADATADALLSLQPDVKALVTAVFDLYSELGGSLSPSAALNVNRGSVTH